MILEKHQFAARAVEFAKKYPGETAMLATSLVGVLNTGFLSAPVIGALGWGAKGVTGDPAAAAIQAGIGNVAGGGVFATLQSAAMGGYGAAIVNGIMSFGAGLMGVGVGTGLVGNFDGEGWGPGGSEL